MYKRQLSGCTAAIAGVLQCMRLKLGQSDLGLNQMFPVVTAIVLGGGSVSGGKGGSLQSFVGVLIYAELANCCLLYTSGSFNKISICSGNDFTHFNFFFFCQKARFNDYFENFISAYFFYFRNFILYISVVFFF